MKALMVASVASMIEQFNMENIHILMNLGYTVDVACNFEQGSTMPTEQVLKFKSELKKLGIQTYQVPIPRNPGAIVDIVKSYNILKNLIRCNKYDIVHCHSPIGGVVARLGSQSARKEGTKVIYTAHGFHFFRGASFKNWMIYYPIEKIMTKYTDELITINNEDYERAKRFSKNRRCAIKYVKGVGISLQKKKINKISKTNKRTELGIKQDTFLITSVGELSRRKNHLAILQALAKMNSSRTDRDITYLIVGTGELEEELRNKTKEYNLEGKVILAGYRTDIKEILQISDCFVFPSLQEGLPVALLEAMSERLPVVCSKIRGNVDLIEENKGGYLVNAVDTDGYRTAIEKMMNNSKKRKEFGKYNEMVAREYDKKKVNATMEQIYKNIKQSGEVPTLMACDYQSGKE